MTKLTPQTAAHKKALALHEKLGVSCVTTYSHPADADGNWPENDKSPDLITTVIHIGQAHTHTYQRECWDRPPDDTERLILTPQRPATDEDIQLAQALIDVAVAVRRRSTVIKSLRFIDAQDLEADLRHRAQRFLMASDDIDDSKAQTLSKLMADLEEEKLAKAKTKSFAELLEESKRRRAAEDKAKLDAGFDTVKYSYYDEFEYEEPEGLDYSKLKGDKSAMDAAIYKAKLAATSKQQLREEQEAKAAALEQLESILDKYSATPDTDEFLLRVKISQAKEVKKFQAALDRKVKKELDEFLAMARESKKDDYDRPLKDYPFTFPSS